MVRLSRTVRFSINPDARSQGCNGFGGAPAMDGLGRYYELDVTCIGSPNPETGYLIDIRQIDRVVRSSVIPLIAEACSLAPQTPAALLMPSILNVLTESALRPIFAAARWKLTPYHSIEMERARPNQVVLRQRFDLAASHRLHSPALSDEENRATFGRCNNPNGHGHNYQVEVAVACTLTDTSAPPPLWRIEELVEQVIIRPFDHKHLNLDTPEFAEGSGVMPSVENIARVFFERLSAPLADALDGAVLASVTVWETDRTWSTFPA
ncbi:MAG: 6-carboxytetrahydropterin synthase [Phycisphaerales bacterium]|nr:6-carboxytetrahydropterin synthase [Phycisphaerales bacterium]